MQALSDANILLVFGTDTGNTEEVADKICDAFAQHGCAVEMVNITDVEAEQYEEQDLIIFGIPTWDFGGIQGDFEEVEADLEALKLPGKTVALYGLGDQLGYGYYFVDAMGWVKEKLHDSGARFIGAWPTEGYDFDESRAANADKSFFCGLAIDEDQQFDLTDDRIETWVKQLFAEFEVEQSDAV